jgi:hypothetical protein
MKSSDWLWVPNSLVHLSILREPDTELLHFLLWRPFNEERFVIIWSTLSLNNLVSDYL